MILLGPAGRRFSQVVARELARRPHLVLVCGRYEGVDERVSEQLVDEELSIGDYVLTGGEPAALVVADAVTRLLPGVLGDEDAPARDSFARGLLEHPQYTRPEVFRGAAVPEVLRSGDHGRIARWRTADVAVANVAAPAGSPGDRRSHPGRAEVDRRVPAGPDAGGSPGLIIEQGASDHGSDPNRRSG